MQNDVLPTPDGPEIDDQEAAALETRRRRLAHSTFCDLLAQLLDLVLELDHDLGDHRVVALRAERVDLAVHLLEQEVELAPGQLGVDEQAPELVEVRPQAHALLGAVEPLGQERDLLRDPHRDRPATSPSSGLSRAIMRSCASFGRSGARSSAAASSSLDRRQPGLELAQRARRPRASFICAMFSTTRLEHLLDLAHVLLVVDRRACPT